ncbi:YbaN family protein [Stenotrophomonas sp.]|uniref:YbaN family protein n=1 Tax=Stenotrophomonas sp. TaxID=69392 RepID=UPI002D5B1728|nr:YbaN family protein [Stenotrophomonas sp.]HYQ25324.1 YbaN family protein [Stenotrophomonas sp.]
MRWLWFALGWLMVGLGVIGALLPVMPTTIFLILAVGCFARSSPKFEQRLLAHPRYGRSLRLWREQGAVSRKGKAFASAGMAVGFALFCLGAQPSWRLLLGVGLFFAASAGYVLSRPAPRLDPTPLVDVGDAEPRAARRRGSTPDADGTPDDAAC